MRYFNLNSTGTTPNEWMHQALFNAFSHLCSQYDGFNSKWQFAGVRGQTHIIKTDFIVHDETNAVERAIGIQIRIGTKSGKLDYGIIDNNDYNFCKRIGLLKYFDEIFSLCYESIASVGFTVDGYTP